jgi:HAE1 family hydrophobic/amphiphilic exporter-1
MRYFITMSALLATILFSAPMIGAMTLEEAIQYGKQNSLKQEGSRIAQEKVEGQIVEAWSNALPQVDALASYQRAFEAPVMYFPGENGSVTKIETQQKNTGYGEATVSQPIYTFGRIGAALNAALETRRSNQLSAAQTEKNLELDIMRAYWTMLLMRDVVQVRKEALDVAESSLERIEKLKNVGLLSEFDVQKVRSQVSSLVPALNEAESNSRLSELAFLELLGAPLDTSVTIEGTLDNFRVETPEDTSTGAALARDDLKSMRAGIEAFEDIYTIYKNAGLPTIASQLKYSWQWGDKSFEINSTNSASSLTGGISMIIPLWTSGKNSGKAQQMKADLRQMQLGLNMAERGIQLQLASARDKYHTALLNEESATIALRHAEETRRIASLRLDNGQITTLELQSAQFEETAAKLAVTSARYNKLIAAAELRLAAGQAPFVLK